MRDHVTIGLIGFGVIGSGTWEVLQEHREEIEARLGAKLIVKWVCSLNKISSTIVPDSVQKTNDWKRVVSDPEVECVVELMGGTEPARTVVLAALKAGKHVVTANKAILSNYWNEIFETAQARRRLVYFEAAVGGGIPVVQALNEGLAANRMRKIVGILNGTTNYILTKMQEGGMSYDKALKEAQKAGFAEANPTFDVEGIDVAQKISILGSLAIGQWISPGKIHTEGISGLQTIDIRLIRDRLHRVIKLLGIGEKTNEGWIFRVHPALVYQTHPFANVRNEYNAVSLHGHPVGDIMLYGKGAGRLPTSSAVVSDIIFLCRQIANGTAGELPFVNPPLDQDLKLIDMSHVRCRYYLRVTTLDKPGVLSRITGILGKHHVSIASVHQDTFDEAIHKRSVPILLLTHTSREKDIQASVKAIDQLAAIKAKTVLLRME